MNINIKYIDCKLTIINSSNDFISKPSHVSKTDLILCKSLNLTPIAFNIAFFGIMTTKNIIIYRLHVN